MSERAKQEEFIRTYPVWVAYTDVTRDIGLHLVGYNDTDVAVRTPTGFFESQLYTTKLTADIKTLIDIMKRVGQNYASLVENYSHIVGFWRHMPFPITHETTEENTVDGEQTDDAIFMPFVKEFEAQFPKHWWFPRRSTLVIVGHGVTEPMEGAMWKFEIYRPSGAPAFIRTLKFKATDIFRIANAVHSMNAYGAAEYQTYYNGPGSLLFCSEGFQFPSNPVRSQLLATLARITTAMDP